MQRCSILLVTGVGFRTTTEKKLNDLQSSFLRSQMQRSSLIVVSGIYIRAMFQKVLNNLYISIP